MLESERRQGGLTLGSLGSLQRHIIVAAGIELSVCCMLWMDSYEEIIIEFGHISGGK